MLTDKRLVELREKPHLSTMDDMLTLISMVEDERLAANVVRDELQNVLTRAETMLKDASLENTKLHRAIDLIEIIASRSLNPLTTEILRVIKDVGGLVTDVDELALQKGNIMDVQQGVPDFIGDKPEDVMTHTMGSLGLCSCGHPMAIHEDGICPVCSDYFDDAVPGGSQGAMRQPCEENKS